MKEAIISDKQRFEARLSVARYRLKDAQSELDEAERIYGEALRALDALESSHETEVKP